MGWRYLHQILTDNLPKQVSSYLSKVITEPKYASSFRENEFAFYIARIKEKYYLTTMDTAYGSLITEKLIKQTNRFVRIDSLLIPLIFDLDITFADFGDVPPRTLNGKSGKKKILLTIEHFLIIFDGGGRIY